MTFYERERARGRQLRSAASRRALTLPAGRARRSSSASSTTRRTSRRARCYRISDLELASRLSFFLWSSIPDDELLDAGDRRAACRSRRCWSSRCGACSRIDARARSAATSPAQWLYLRNLRGSQPDADVFPDFDDDLREALQRETELLFESIVLEDRSVLRPADADYTFVNERLARHYGIPNVYGSSSAACGHRRRAPRPARARQHPDAHLVRQPDVAGAARQVGADEHPRHAAAAAAARRAAARREARRRRCSMRDRMEEHRSNPACASCHKLMDPIGFALENFDAIGRWRTVDNGAAIDASAQLADGARGRRPGGAAPGTAAPAARCSSAT